MEKVFLVVLISYFIGNISPSYIFGKVFGKIDIRKHGSGNAGATNTLRVLGAKVAGMTFLVDALKGVLAVAIGRGIYGYYGALIAAVFVIIGHDWPVVLKFKGGKGIATSIGSVMVISPITALICILVGLALVIKTKYVSLGSVTGVGILPFVGLLTIRPFDINFLIFSIIVSVLAIFRHRTNIYRLTHGKESKLGQKAK